MPKPRESSCFQCNHCWEDVEAGQGYATECNHVFCGNCAGVSLENSACLACGANVSSASFHILWSGAHKAEKARRLGTFDVDTIMAAASGALSLLAYQEKLKIAKKQQTEKAQLKKLVSQSKAKMQDLQSAAQKAQLKCKEIVHAKTKIEKETNKLEAYINKKATQAKRLKEAIRRSQHNQDGVGEIHSDAGSDGAWELLHQEVHVTAPQGFTMAQPAHGRQHRPRQDPTHQPQLQIADYTHNNNTPETDLGAMLRNPSSSALGGNQGSRHPHLASLLAGSQGHRQAGPGRLSAGSTRTNASQDKDARQQAAKVSPLRGYISGSCAVVNPR
eukprot:jgi/Ulvmu1/9245/UM005_0345.1